MKVMKKMFNVILIFAIIQLIGIVFVNNKTYAGGDSFFEKAFEGGRQWKEMGGTNSEIILNSANGITQATDDIYNGIRAIGIGIFMINITAIFITLSMKNNGKDIAGAKMTIAFSFVLALLFIFAQNIMGFLANLFEQFEGLM